MADLAITPSEVLPDPNVEVKRALAGEVLATGDSAYKGSNGKLLKTDADDTAAKARAAGIVLNDANAVNAPVAYQEGGDITLGATCAMTVGVIYGLSKVAGKICPVADLVAQGDYVTILGVAKTAAVLKTKIFATGIQIA